MTTLNVMAVMAFMSFIYIFFNVAYGEASLPILKIESRHPLSLSWVDQGMSYDVLLPSEFIHELEGVYDTVHIEDLTGDGTGEVVFDLIEGGGNSCARVLHYTNGKRSLSEMIFGAGGICNFKVGNGYVISSYKDGAAWVEDVYFFKKGKPYLKISDRCVGCGEISRKEYRSDGSFNRLLVSDEASFDQRSALTAKVASPKAWIFPSLGAAKPTRKYLTKGDEITLVSIDNAREIGWVEFRFLGGAAPEGWLKCSDVEECSKF